MIGLLVSVLAVIALTLGNPLCPSEGDEVIIYPNQYDCTTFYQCYQGDLVLKKCPDNLHFNPELLVCDWPWAFNCVESPPQPKWLPGNDNITAITEPPPVCPPPGTEVNATSFVYRYNCSQYWICESGAPFLRNCPPGLNFNVVLGVCDFPWATTCVEISSVVPAEAKIPAMEKPAETHRALSPYCRLDGNPPDCPPPPVVGNVTYCPFISNCSLFWFCDNGRPFLRDCPPGLHYNRDNEVCDFPWAANCVPVLQLDVPAVVKIQEVKKPKENQRALSPLCRLDGSPPNCPPPPGVGNVTTCPDIYNCSQYWFCDNGRPFTAACPGELEYSVDLEGCDYWWAAECTEVPQPDVKNVPAKVNLPTVKEMVETDRALSEYCRGADPPACPPPPVTGNITTCPDITNCSQYWLCDNGRANLTACPAELHYSVDLEVCDHIWAAGCQPVKLRSEADVADKVRIPAPDTNRVEIKGNSEYCNDGGPPSCPPPPGIGNVTFCRDTTNCSCYYTCDSSGSNHQSCPIGLEWNNDIDACDFPWAANCLVGKAYDGDEDAKEKFHKVAHAVPLTKSRPSEGPKPRY